MFGGMASESVSVSKSVVITMTIKIISNGNNF
jgi:hypothetical protein